MSVQRRRLWATGTICVAMWTAFTTISSSSPEVRAQPTSDARLALTSTSSAPSLLPLDMITLRPFVTLREPGEPGVIIAHRGNPEAAPENTLPAFLAATSAGAKYFEIDLRVSKDGVPVVIHDKTVNRTTGGEGVVAEMTIDDLRALDAGSWFSERFAGTAIPTLDEVLSLAATSESHVVIEYKGSWTKADIGMTVEMIEAAGLEGKIITQSFNEKTVANVAKVAPGIPVGWLTQKINTSIVTTAQKLGADAINPRHATAQSVTLAHEAGLGVFVWTHDSDSEWELLTAMGVDGIITNRPGALFEWMTFGA